MKYLVITFDGKAHKFDSLTLVADFIIKNQIRLYTDVEDKDAQLVIFKEC